MNKTDIANRFRKWSVRRALAESNSNGMLDSLRQIVPDISGQEDSEKETFNDYWELKRRALQAFQCGLMLKALETLPSGKLVVADIGDSAGTHLTYLKEMTRGRRDIYGIGVNLDPAAVEKIRSRGLEAVLSRAEELDLGPRQVDLAMSFQMLEHLHDPAKFLRRLAKHSTCKKIVITVPYLKRSRMGLHYLRQRSKKKINAGDEHIFELNPEDWTLLFLHAGWKVVYSDVHYQYPRRWPLASRLLSIYWKGNDYEGFWGAILERDLTYSDLYSDWEDGPAKTEGILDAR